MKSINPPIRGSIEGHKACKGEKIWYQSPYKGFNSWCGGSGNGRKEAETPYQSPYKGFNRTR